MCFLWFIRTRSDQLINSIISSKSKHTCRCVFLWFIRSSKSFSCSPSCLTASSAADITFPYAILVSWLIISPSADNTGCFLFNSPAVVCKKKQYAIKQSVVLCWWHAVCTQVYVWIMMRYKLMNIITTNNIMLLHIKEKYSMEGIKCSEYNQSTEQQHWVVMWTIVIIIIILQNINNESWCEP